MLVNLPAISVETPAAVSVDDIMTFQFRSSDVQEFRYNNTSLNQSMVKNNNVSLKIELMSSVAECFLDL